MFNNEAYKNACKYDGWVNIHEHLPEEFWPEKMEGIECLIAQKLKSGALKVSVSTRKDDWYFMNDKLQTQPLAESWYWTRGRHTAIKYWRLLPEPPKEVNNATHK